MASSVPPVKGVAFTFDLSLVSQADTDIFKTSVTLAAGDVQVSKSGAALNNITSLPTEISTSGVLAVALSATEMDADRVTVLFHDAAGDEWQDALVTIYTAAQTLDTTDAVADAVKVKTDYLPSATAGAAGGVFIAGSNAATSVNITGNLSGSVGSVTGAVGSVTGLTASNLDTTVSSRAAATTALSNAVWTDGKAGYLDAAISTRTKPADTQARVTLVDTASAVTGLTPGNLDATISSRAAADTALSSAVWTNTKAGYLDAAVSSRSTVTTAQVNAEMVDALAVDVVADSIPADGSRPTITQALYMLVQFMLERSVAGTTMTVKKPDGTTTLLTLTLNDGTAPTSITRSS